VDRRRVASVSVLEFDGTALRNGKAPSVRAGVFKTESDDFFFVVPVAVFFGSGSEVFLVVERSIATAVADGARLVIFVSDNLAFACAIDVFAVSVQALEGTVAVSFVELENTLRSFVLARFMGFVAFGASALVRFVVVKLLTFAVVLVREVPIVVKVARNGFGPVSPVLQVVAAVESHDIVDVGSVADVEVRGIDVIDFHFTSSCGTVTSGVSARVGDGSGILGVNVKNSVGDSNDGVFVQIIKVQKGAMEFMNVTAFVCLVVLFTVACMLERIEGINADSVGINKRCVAFVFDRKVFTNLGVGALKNGCSAASYGRQFAFGLFTQCSVSLGP
jgi:hypothetical protein